MDLSLGFLDFSQELAVATKPSLEAVVSRFRSVHKEPDSPVRAIHHQAATPGTFVDVPAGVDERLRKALADRGIAQLYTHQADTFELTSSGKNVVVVTPTASGKTLCYNLPVFNLLLGNDGARAMYVFPTKALAEDQLARIPIGCGRDGVGDSRVHVRRRHAAGCAESDPAEGQRGVDQSRHAAQRDSAAPHAVGQALSRICDTS